MLLLLLRFLSFRAPALLLLSGSCPSLSFCNFSTSKPTTCYAPNWSKSSSIRMGEEDNAMLKERKQHASSSSSVRLCSVSSFTTEILELRAENPSLQILLIPGNPGVVQFYTEFVEAMYEMLGGCASITVVGHISHTRKDWERGRLFSLQDQVDHKVAFIKQELQDTEIPLLLVGHSIGSYISLEIFKRLPDQVKYCIGLYPFLSLNKDSSKQIGIGKLAASPILCTLLSSIVAFLGLFPRRTSSFLVKRSVGKSWTTTSVEALCSHLLQYHTMRNILFLAMTEFEKLAEAPDWKFMTGKQDQLAFLFGIDDHWGPLSMFEEISKQVENVSLSIEKEGHTHAFSCTEAGSVWVADHVVGLIKHQFQANAGKACLKTRKMIWYAEVIKPRTQKSCFHLCGHAGKAVRVMDTCALRRCRIVNKAPSSLEMCFGDYPAEGIYVDVSYFDDEHLFS